MSRYRHTVLSNTLRCFWSALLVAGVAMADTPQTSEVRGIDQRAALRASQAVLGHEPRDYEFLDSTGRAVRLSSYRGKPLVVNFIYTGCIHVCPPGTLALKTALNGMHGSFGRGQFEVVSIGFNPPSDSPTALRAFAAQQRIDQDNWTFLSPRIEDVASLTRDFGFTYAPTPGGYDHVLQVTLVDAQGRIARQVYGEQFNAAAIGEPLKDLVMGRMLSDGPSLSDLFERVRILCSVYDAQSGRYRFDYTLPLQVAGGVTFIVAMLWFAIAEHRARRRGATT